MKPLNESELRDLVEWMKPRVEGARLQDVGADESGLWLEIYRHGARWIRVDLKPGRGFLALWPENQGPGRQLKPKPLSLFLKSHARNLELRTLRMKEGYGRVVEMLFQSADGERSCGLTLVLIPQALNALAEAGDKKLSWEKPRPLEPQADAGAYPVRITNWEDYARELSASRPGGVAGPIAKDQRIEAWQKLLRKKQNIVQKLDEARETLDARSWSEFGEELKFGRELPEHPLWDPDLGLTDNRERAFRKAKESKAKLEGNRRRREDLIAEIQELEVWIQDPAKGPAPRDSVKGRGTKALEASATKGRTLNLSSGLQAIIGRSARDNLSILRQARAWDLWLHLKDEPGAHAILFREKNQNVGRADIEEVAQWLYRESHGKKSRLAGLRFEVIVVECRFVRPIKGDQLGRVNYHSPTVYSFASKE